MNQRLLRLRVSIAALAIVLAACSGPPNPLARPKGAVPHPSATVQGGAGTVASPGTIDAFVPAAVRFVESHRGLRFKQPVKVDHLADRDFQQRIIDLSTPGKYLFVCNLPSHFGQGMQTLVTVTP